MSMSEDEQMSRLRHAVIGRCRLVAAGASAVAAAGVILVAPVGSSHAAPVFQVIDPEDAPDAQLDGVCASTHMGLCTLRAAIQEAEFAGGGHVVLSTGIGDYRLTIPAGAEATGPPSNATGDLDISTTVTVEGGGPDASVIDGNGTHRIFDAHAGGTLSLTNLTLQNGKGDYDGATGHSHGGAIHNHGTVNLDRVAIINSSVVDPSAATPFWGGGGMTNASNGVANLSNVTVAKDTTDAHGGGIENLGELHMQNVTVAENAAASGNGGGIFFGGASKTFTGATLVAKDTAGGDCASAAGSAMTSSGANLAGDGTCGFNNASDRTGDPGFDTSVFGPPLFHPLLATSQAVDTGTVCQPTDIRGVTRPQDGNGDGTALCDTGSYERAAAPAPPAPTPPTPPAPPAPPAPPHAPPAPAQASVSIADARGREGTHIRKHLRFTVTLSARATQTITVRATTQDGTAKAGSDFVAKTATLTFERGDRTATFTVKLIRDRVPEPDETFKVKLSSPSGATIADGEAIGTIVNDD
jgi:hypothetical protein